MRTILDLFQANVEKYGDRACVWHKRDGKWVHLSWNDVSLTASSLCRGLASLGVQKGVSVGIISATRVEWTLIDLAILSAGGVVIPVYPSLSADQIAYILKDSAVKILFVENHTLLKKIERVRNDLPELRSVILIEGGDHNALTLNSLSVLGEGKRDPKVVYNADDVASIIYTSGTTGKQKGVIITHSNIVAEVRGLMGVFKLDVGDTMLTVLPLAHVLARAVQFFQLAHGCESAYAESVEKVPENLIEVRPHMVVVVPRFIEKIYDRLHDKVIHSGKIMRLIFGRAVSVGHARSLAIRRGEKISLRLKLKSRLAEMLIFKRLQAALGGRIKFIVSGGAPLSAELSKFFHGAGLLILEGYGLTETFAAATVNRLDDFRLGTVGKPIDGVDIKIAPDGEILIKGDILFKGYYKAEGETKETFTPDGWLKTGDIGEFTKDGFLRITDRKKNMIITAGGKNIAPQAIESKLQESPYINHAVILGDRRKYVSAIISVNIDAVKKYADKKMITYRSPQELVRSREIKDLITGVIEEKNKELSQFETIKKFAILDRDFTIETGELTPTMKVRRKAIEENYKAIVEELYN